VYGKNTENGLQIWHLADELSVVQASLLYLYKNPAKVHGASDVDGYDAVFTGFTHAILSGRLPANIRGRADKRGWLEPELFGGGSRLVIEPDWRLTTVRVKDVRNWLASRGVTTGFFFEDRPAGIPDYLNERHPHFAHRLAAAIWVWQEIAKDPARLKGKSPKRALKELLGENAQRLGLVVATGEPNSLAIEEIAKVANWETQGGAPKTPLE
jgi:hypothetical protein